MHRTFDLKNALESSDRENTAFMACGNLYHFKRIPFGVSNGVAAFQRNIKNIMKEEGLTASFAYFDNVAVCGNDIVEYDLNLKFVRDTA